MKIFTRYPLKIAGTLFPENTEVQEVPLKEVQKSWPNIQYQKGSNAVAIKIGGFTCCIVAKKQLRFEE